MNTSELKVIGVVGCLTMLCILALTVIEPITNHLTMKACLQYHTVQECKLLME